MSAAIMVVALVVDLSSSSSPVISASGPISCVLVSLLSYTLSFPPTIAASGVAGPPEAVGDLPVSDLLRFIQDKVWLSSLALSPLSL